MTPRDIVVIGASAGGVEALTTLVRALPPDLPAALFVVVHVPPYGGSRLPAVLSRAGPQPAAHAVHGELIHPGRIYVAPPDRHLLVRQGWVDLSRGPRENHSRPAIDPLFRSAARSYGSRVVGIILSGALYDGSLGLMAVHTRGGLAIVQDPQEAVVESMPRSALKLVAADYVLPAADIAGVIAEFASRPEAATGEAPMTDQDERLQTVIAHDFADQADDDRVDETTVYTCPDCGGVMWQEGSGATLGFRCHVGHAFAPEILLDQKSEEFESALWASLRLLKEKATLTRQLAASTRAGTFPGGGAAAERIEEQAELDERYVRVIQEVLEAMPNPADRSSNIAQAVDAAD
jgi:two-component system, chemotaxis family, protein-glutamate methylesterase/glutaminase